MNQATDKKEAAPEANDPEVAAPEMDIEALMEENMAMRTELQRVLKFANERNVQIYAQAYIAAIGVKHPAPDVLATKCLTDLKNAFGMQNPAANH